MIPKRQHNSLIPPFSGGDYAIRTWLMPVGIVASIEGDAAGDANGILPLAGGPLGFSHLDVFIDDGTDITVTRVKVAALMEYVPDDAAATAQAALNRITSPRADFAELDMAQAHVMGIINATPDSFSDGGDHLATAAAIQAAHDMAQAGATILDIGGESTRPGAAPVSHDEECQRILPVIDALVAEGHTISADTRHTAVMAHALDHGAHIINDVGGLRDDGAIALAAESQTPVIIMHMQGTPGDMQKNPQYRFAPLDIYDWLEARITACEAAGLPRHLIAVDPGFGFGKTPHHNMEIMAHLGLFHGLGVPIVLGVSRKSTIAHFARGEVAKDRMPGSVALAAMGRGQGVQIFRVHDVAETYQALANTEAVLASRY